MADEQMVPQPPGTVVVSLPDPPPEPTKRAQLQADRDAKAAADQSVIDAARGYRQAEWKPGLPIFQSLDGGHATFTEADMIAFVQEMRARTANGIITPA